MITKRPLRSPEKSAVKKNFLIVSISSHSLAASAARAGFNSNIIDCFCDEDTLELCSKSFLLDDFSSLRENQFLEPILDEINPETLDGLVVGSGFEQQPELINVFPSGLKAYSNTVETIRCCSDPEQFFPILENLEIQFPDVYLGNKRQPGEWLVKSKGGHGGSHIRWAKKGESIHSDEYLQRYCPGDHYSCVFFANRVSAEIIGFNQTWCKKLADKEFNYGGAASVLDFDKVLQSEVKIIIKQLVAKLKLIGLCGMDFIVTNNGEIKVLEINPRPTQTMELFDNEKGSLFTAHLGCFDELKLPIINPPEMNRGHEVIYAIQAMTIPDNLNWPDWTSNRPKAGTVIKKGDPLCSVHAEAETTREVLEQLIKQCNILKYRNSLEKNSFAQ